jgi:urease accessory protein
MSHSWLQPPGERPAASVERLMSYLAVLQLTDSAFPSGRYTLSHGLESFAQHGALTSRQGSSLETLLNDSLRFAVAPSDGVALAWAHRAVGADGHVDLEVVTRADERLSAVKLAREGREASKRTGRALLGTALAAFKAAPLLEYTDAVHAGRSPGNHAVVLGILCAWCDVPRLDAVAAELYAFSAGWVASAVRLALIDYRGAQGLLGRVRPVIADAALMSVERDITSISSCTPLLDVMSMRHEEAELRLFAS